MARRIASRYTRRIQNVGRMQARARGDVAKLLVQGLREATQAQLYDVTPLPVSRKMLRSIRPVMLGQAAVGVEYNRAIAPYAGIRLNKKGRSVAGGHKMDMAPNAYLRRKTDPKIARLVAQSKSAALTS